MKYEFIINPVSGSINKSNLLAEIEQEMKVKSLDYSIRYSEYKGHSIQLAKELRNQPNTTIIAVGGDGTVNEIGSQLIGTTTILGLIPLGSGNGLARHLKLPLDPMQALQVIIAGKSQKIDAGKLNGNTFFVTCGLGFEAEVSHNFNKRNTRGLIGYVKETIKLYPTYKSEEYILEYNGITKKRKAFSITVANSSQYGNNAIIAKDASVQDGKLDLCVIKSYPKLFGPQMGLSLFLKNLHNSSFYRAEQVERVSIGLEGNYEIANAHIDGEAIKVELPLIVECLSKTLNILVSENWM